MAIPPAIVRWNGIWCHGSFMQCEFVPSFFESGPTRYSCDDGKEPAVLMSAKDYSRLAAIIFAIVALLQLVRAVSGWPITIGATTSIPLWASLGRLRCS